MTTTWSPAQLEHTLGMRAHATEVLNERTANRIADMVDLVLMGAWPIGAAETVGWKPETARDRLQAAADEATDPDVRRDLLRTRAALLEAMDRYQAATGTTAGRKYTRPTRSAADRANERRRAKRRAGGAS